MLPAQRVASTTTRQRNPKRSGERPRKVDRIAIRLWCGVEKTRKSLEARRPGTTHDSHTTRHTVPVRFESVVAHMPPPCSPRPARRYPIPRAVRSSLCISGTARSGGWRDVQDVRLPFAAFWSLISIWGGSDAFPLRGDATSRGMYRHQVGENQRNSSGNDP